MLMRFPQPLVVVQRQQGCLTRGACSTSEKSGSIIPFDLDRTAVTLLHEQAASRRARTAGCRIPAGDAGCDLIRTRHRRNRILYWSATTTKRCGRQSEAHQRQKIAARILLLSDLIGKPGKAAWKLRRRRRPTIQFLQTLPVDRTYGLAQLPRVWFVTEPFGIIVTADTTSHFPSPSLTAPKTSGNFSGGCRTKLLQLDVD